MKDRYSTFSKLGSNLLFCMQNSQDFKIAEAYASILPKLAIVRARTRACLWCPMTPHHKRRPPLARVREAWEATVGTHRRHRRRAPAHEATVAWMVVPYPGNGAFLNAAGGSTCRCLHQHLRSTTLPRDGSRTWKKRNSGKGIAPLAGTA